jgi:uncharacterized protein (TIGR02996 family)
VIRNPPDEERILDAVRKATDDDGPRLVAADWYDDRDDPRGRFIRVQLALARLSPYDSRRVRFEREERELLGLYGKLWMSTLAAKATGIVFRRGFIDELNMTARQFLASAEEVFSFAPIRQLHLLDAGQNLPAVLASPFLARLAGLSIYAQYLGGTGHFTALLAGSPSLKNLKQLRIGRNRLRDDDLTQFVQSPLADSLEDLDLHENELTDEIAASLGEAGTFPKLCRLNVSRTRVGPVAASAIATAGHRPVLTALNLAGNEAVGRVSTSDLGLFRVAELDLTETQLTVFAMDRYVQAVDTPSLRVLTAVGNPLGNAGAERLATSPAFGNVRILDLKRCEIGSDGAEQIAHSQTLVRLERLDLTSNPIDPLGWAALLSKANLKSLRRLDLPEAGISAVLRDALNRKYNRVRKTSKLPVL